MNPTGSSVPARVRGWWRAEFAPLVTILLIVSVLGLVYSIVTPIFEASDEAQHYPYVRFIAQGHGLPVQDPQDPGDWLQEGSQPPLFYLLGALATFWIDTSDYEELRWENPHARIGIPGSHGNKNMFVHTDREGFPYQGTVLAVHLLRLVSLIFAVGSVAITYLLVLEVFPERRALAATAAVFHGLNPMFLFISASVANDGLTVFLASLGLWMTVRMLKGEMTRARWAALGAVVGLGALTKLSALPLAALALLVLAYLAYQQRSPRLLLRSLLWTFVPAALIAGWWYLRNYTLYGDPLGLNVMLEIAGRRPVTASLQDLVQEIQGFWISYWSIFGGFNVLSAPIAYRVFEALTLVAVLGWARLVYVWWKKGSVPQWRPLAILALWVLLLFVGLMRWTQATYASSGRLIFPGISAVSLFLALGWSALAPSRMARWIPLGPSALLGTIALATPFLVIAPPYARPPLLTEAELASVPRGLDATYGDVFRLLGYDLEDQALGVGDSVWVTLYWQAVAPMEKAYSIGLIVLGPGERVYGQLDTYPGLGTFPTSLWRVGDAIAETYAIPLTGEPPYAAAGPIEVVVYQFPTLEKLEAEDPQGQLVGRVTAGRVKLIPQTAPTYTIQNPTHYDLDDRIALIGYDIGSAAAHAGGFVQLTLYWEALAPIDQDYTVFVHLVDEDGNLRGQKDQPPLGGEYPTTLWGEGEIIRDEYIVEVDSRAQSGSYAIQVGMYEPEISQRLVATDVEGNRLRTDAIPLASVLIR